MSLTSNLYRLQQLDSTLDKNRARLAEIERILSESGPLQRAEQLHQAAQAALAEAQKALRAAEALVTSQRIKIEQTEAALYGGRVHNPKELQDLQNESTALKRYLSTLEDRQLEAMLEQESCEAATKETLAGLQAAQADTIQNNAQFNAEKTALAQAEERLAVERQMAVAAIPAAELALYDQLRQARRGVAVALVSGRACSACGVGLTPAAAQSASAGATITRCPSCGRILYGG